MSTILSGIAIGFLAYLGFRWFLRRLWGKSVICAYGNKWKMVEAYDPIEDYPHFTIWRKILFCWLPIFTIKSDIAGAKSWGKRLGMKARGLGPGCCQNMTAREIEAYTEEYGGEFT